MLTENHVVEFVCRHISGRGYEVLRQLRTNERGRDIVAIKRGTPAVELRVEAKGETSSKDSTKRFGKPFNTAQVRDHVSNAFYCVASMIEPSTEQCRVRVAMALPGTQGHRKQVAAVREAATTLGIGVFWVAPDGTIEFEAPWQL